MDPLENNFDEFLIDNLTNRGNESVYNYTDTDNYYYHFAIAMEVSSAICGFVGSVADIMIILLIVKNIKLQSRTNILILNFAICDLLFLICSTSIAYSLLYAIKFERYHFVTCLLEYFDISLHLNTSLVIIVIMTNTIYKNQAIKTSQIVMALYSLIMASLILQTITCCTLHTRVLMFACFLIFFAALGILIMKEINSCYKTRRLGDPICEQTRFRLNIARIFVYNYTFTCLFALVVDLFINYANYVYLLVNGIFLTSLYLLIFLVKNDRNFNECFFKMLKCQRGNLDADGLDDLAEIGNETSTPPYDVLREQLERK